MKTNASQRKNKGIYILTNTVNNKKYVGMDSNIPCRFNQHIKGIAKCPLLYEALSAFGLDKWMVQFIPYPLISNTALRSVEQWYICKLKTKHPDGYNMRDGSNPSLKQKRKRLNHLTPVAKRRADLKAQVRERRREGAVLEAISTEFNLSIGTVSRWCEGINVLSPTETEVMGLLEGGEAWKTSDIEKCSIFTRQAVTIALKKLLEKKLIAEIKRGHYQKIGVRELLDETQRGTYALRTPSHRASD